MRRCTQARDGEKGGGGDARYWDDHPLAPVSHPHALLTPLDFLLRNSLQSDLAHDLPRRRVGLGISRDHEGERA